MGKFSGPPKYKGEVDVSVHQSGEVHIKVPGGIKAYTSKTVLEKNKGKTFSLQKKK